MNNIRRLPSFRLSGAKRIFTVLGSVLAAAVILSAVSVPIFAQGPGNRVTGVYDDALLLNDSEESALETLEKKESHYHTPYPDEMSLKDKISVIAKEIYGADGVTYAPAAAKALARIEEMGFGNLPVCMAKTQYSLSDDQTKLGRPTGFTINVRDTYVSAGAGFVVVLTGAIMTMPGLPKKPAADNIDVDENGVITGLF